MTIKKVPSAVPYYVVGLSWLLYVCIFPLYRWFDFVIAAAISIILWFLMKSVFPGKEIIAEAPINTGNAELDAVIRRGQDAIRQMRSLNAEIKNTAISIRIDEMEMISSKIFEFLKQEPDKISSVRTFMNYYLPTGIKLLTTYQELEQQGGSGENISGTIRKIEEVMETVVEAFRKEQDGLFDGTALDIAAEVRTLHTMMNQHGFHIDQ